MMQIAIAVDQLLNAICLGKADETLSARFYRNRNNSGWWSFWYRATNVLFFWQEDHCRASYYSELNRRQLPKEYRERTTKERTAR